MNMSNYEKLKISLDRDLARRTLEIYKGLSDSARRSLVATPVFSRLYHDLTLETDDGNLARFLESDYYAMRRERSQ